MSIHRIALMSGVSFAPGGAHMPKPNYDRQTFGSIPYAKQTDGTVCWYLGDDKRLRIPVTSQAWIIEDGVPGSEVAPPDWSWQLESVVFRTAISVGGRHVTLNFWSVDKNPDIAATESARGLELAVPGTGTVIVPWHSIATLRDKRVAVPTIQPPRADDFVVEESTPAAPPRRSTKTEPTSRSRY